MNESTFDVGEVVYFLENKYFLQVDLNFSPSPQEIPSRPKVETMRKLTPPLSSVETLGDDVIDLV